MVRSPARSPVRHPLVPVAAWRRMLRRLRTSLALRWLAVAAAAGLVAAEASRLSTDAAAERAAWGSSAPVVVALGDLQVGDVVGPGDVSVDEWPEAVIPPGAVATPPVGRVVTAPIVEGEAVVAARLAPAGLRGAAALIPDGFVAVAVPASSSYGAPAPPLELGDRVDVLAPDVVADGAVVVAVDDDAVTVAVPSADAADVADAVAASIVTLALRGAA